MFHSWFDTSMVHPADMAYDIEQATESSLNFVFQLVALSSGVIESDDYILKLETFEGGEHYGIRQGSYNLPDQITVTV